MGNHPQGVYSQNSNHQRPFYKFRMFHLAHPTSTKQQHAICHHV
ncbi:hypothetical protein COLO4_25114 [Corchorus olitorius]|uniref:Uncharacterized protein n=1 Tax=Corchorus olitorius TaxID=93759 RepID=A0A1R3I4M3_9ROSI|nr:hypothetical protein COLO4_25114 [Corchorus olitorius]